MSETNGKRTWIIILTSIVGTGVAVTLSLILTFGARVNTMSVDIADLKAQLKQNNLINLRLDKIEASINDINLQRVPATADRFTNARGEKLEARVKKLEEIVR